MDLNETVTDCTWVFTYPSEYHNPEFIFDLQVAYRVDQGDTAVPGGNCSLTPGKSCTRCL